MMAASNNISLVAAQKIRQKASKNLIHGFDGTMEKQGAEILRININERDF
jgi:hypothetical protein